MSPAGASPLTVHMIGGCGAFGRNCLALEQDGEAVIVDCGSQFPAETAFDVSCLIPHPERLWEHVPRPLAYLLTHGHEDHVGALPHLLAHAPAPVHGTPFTLGLVAERWAALPPAIRRASPLVELVPGRRVALSERIAFTALPVAHSILQATALVLELPAGAVVHTGDFKLAGDDAWRLELDALAKLAPEPLLVLADSTGACNDDETPPEAALAGRVRELVADAPGRLFVTVFSSHVARMRAFLAAGAAFGRQGAALGRSMERTTATARDLGLLPEANFTTCDEVVRLPPERQLFFVSGSQGENASAMDRLSLGQNPRLVPGPGDTVVFSVSTIPGRELPVSQLIDRLLERGATVRVHTAEAPTHVSGHGSAPELARLYEALRPRAVIPVHGSLRYLQAGLALARASGAEAFWCPDGHRAVHEAGAWRVEPVPGLDEVLCLENPQDGPVCAGSLRERRRLAITGAVFVSCAVDRRGRPKAAGLQVSLMGIARLDDHPALSEGCARAILAAAPEDGDEAPERTIELAVRRFFKSGTGKKPQVVVHLIH